MKRFVRTAMGTLVASSMVLSMVGCGSTEAAAPAADSSTPAASTEEAAAPAEATEEVYTAELKLGHIQPTDHPNGLGAEEFARLVSEKSDGNITVSVFPASQLGSEKELFDAMEMGSIDFTVLGYGEPAKKYAPVGISDAPFLATDRDHMMRILNSDVMAAEFEEMENYMNVTFLAPIYYGARYTTTANAEVSDMASLSGLNIRVPDQALYIDTLNLMGAVATPMAFSEVFLSLQQGVIDGQENPLATIAANKFNEVQKYLIKTEHIIGTNAFYVSSKTLEGMPESAQAIIMEAAEEAAAYTNQLAYELEDSYLVELQEGGMVLIDDVNKEEFQAATASIYDDYDADFVASLRGIE